MRVEKANAPGLLIRRAAQISSGVSCLMESTPNTSTPRTGRVAVWLRLAKALVEFDVLLLWRKSPENTFTLPSGAVDCGL